MKNYKLTLFCAVMAMLFFCSGNISAQKLLKGVAKSYDAGVSAFNKKKYKEASEEFIVVLDNVPDDIDKRKYQAMRLDAASKLVEIHYEHEEDLRKACKYIDVFLEDLNIMKKDNTLRAKDIYKYLEKEKEFASYKRKCESFNSIEDKKKDFEKKFDEVFDKEGN
jgi:hypothetical protein